MNIIGYIRTPQRLQPFGKGWSWCIEIRAEDYSWSGSIHRAKGLRGFASAENARRKAEAVANELGIELKQPEERR